MGIDLKKFRPGVVTTIIAINALIFVGAYSYAAGFDSWLITIPTSVLCGAYFGWMLVLLDQFYRHREEAKSGKVLEVFHGHVSEIEEDSYGARPISPAILQAVQRFLESLPDFKHPCVVPTSGGSIQLEWQASPKLLEMEFETAETIHYLKWDESANIEEEDTFQTSDVSRATELIQWVLAGEGQVNDG